MFLSLKSTSRKVSLVLITIILILSSSAVHASSVYQNNNDEQKTKVVTFLPDDPEQFIKDQGWEKPHPDAKLVEVARVTELRDTKVEDIITPQFIYSIRNVENRGQLCGVNVRARTSGSGNADGVLTLSNTVSVSNSYNAEVGVSAKVVSGGVGFDVDSSWESTASYQVNTHGKNYQIVAYDDFEGYAFDIYNLFGKYAGSGMAFQHVGFCYAVYEF